MYTTFLLNTYENGLWKHMGDINNKLPFSYNTSP